MATECAFCPATANLSAEHLWSRWMGDLFPGRKRFTRKDEKGEIVGEWSSDKLDWKARVVCEPCNNTWMSDIENRAKPVLCRFILGEARTISQQDADVIAPFALKTAVIFDHIRFDHAEPFFGRSVRHVFKNERAIPATVRTFFGAYLPRGKGEVHSCYHDGVLRPNEQIKLYVCTYAAGHLVFQVVGQKQTGLTRVSLQPKTFRAFGVEFWLWMLNCTAAWPPPDVLQDAEQFDSFSARWRNLIATSEA
jgi:hypothetical protein